MVVGFLRSYLCCLFIPGYPLETYDRGDGKKIYFDVSSNFRNMILDCFFFFVVIPLFLIADKQVARVARVVLGVLGATSLVKFVLDFARFLLERHYVIDIRPTGTTRLGYHKMNLINLLQNKVKLDGSGLAIWPNGIAFEGIFEDNRIKDDEKGSLILLPDKDRYSLGFSGVGNPGVENKDSGCIFDGSWHFSGVEYNNMDKLLRFSNGDSFEGVLDEDVEGFYRFSNGTTVKGTLTNVLRKRVKNEKESAKWQVARIGKKARTFYYPCSDRNRKGTRDMSMEDIPVEIIKRNEEFSKIFQLRFKYGYSGSLE
jgi:hypothetical protein